MTPLTDSERALVTQHVRLAGLAASRTREYGRRVGFEFDELFSIACLGLVKGIRNFDPSISKPSTFLYTCCMREVLRTIRYQLAEALWSDHRQFGRACPVFGSRRTDSGRGHDPRPIL